MKPRPKFCVGEEVDVISAITPGKIFYRDEIDAIEWDDPRIYHRFGVYRGWSYHMAGDDPKIWIREANVRKRPHEERTQWKDCAWQPNNQEVTA